MTDGLPDDAPGNGRPEGEVPAPSAEMAELLALVDRLEGLLERSDLLELEVEAGGVRLVLRTPAAIGGGRERPEPAPGALPPGEGVEQGSQTPAAADAPGARRAVLAPLTGIFYAAPTPEAAPYVRVGGDVHVGQVVGLIEAMKLFNEIKSDIAGRVLRVAAESGTLVKAKQALIEVEPA